MVLQSLHANHPGIVRMKALARSYVWWPGMDAEVAEWVAACSSCQASRPAPPVSPPREWDAPRSPWSRLHLDFAGPFHGQNFLVVVDAFSRWVEVILMASTTAESTVRALRRLFATHGLPDVVVSDNGPQFQSSAFLDFLATQGIRHAPVAPYHPASNGRAERAVRSAKEALARMDKGDWQARVAAYLLGQHVTPCSATGKSPAELLMGRRLRTTLDRLHPDYDGLQRSNLHTPTPRLFKPGDLVWARNFSGEPRWVAATIADVTGPCSYRVSLLDGSEWRRHLDQLRSRQPEAATSPPGGSSPLAPVGPLISAQAEQPFEKPESFALPDLVFTDTAGGNLPDFPTVPDSQLGAWPIEGIPCQMNNRQPNSPAPSHGTAPTRPDAQGPPAPPTAAIETRADQADAGDGFPIQQEEHPVELRRSGRTRHRPSYLKDYACACITLDRDTRNKRTNYGGRSVESSRPRPRQLVWKPASHLVRSRASSCSSYRRQAVWSLPGETHTHCCNSLTVPPLNSINKRPLHGEPRQ